MSPSSSNWLVILGALLILPAIWWMFAGAVRLGFLLSAAALLLGAITRLLGAPLVLYEATTWLIWLGVVLALVAGVRRKWFTGAARGPG